MALNLAQKLIEAHRDKSNPDDSSLALNFDQTLCQDATGTLVMLALEAMELDEAKTHCSVQYVDHNLIQEDYKNPDDHLFLLSAAQRFGLWFSRPGNGISHPLHMKRFGIPGHTLIGSDSHTCAAGALGMLAMGAGGADVALAIAGRSVNIPTPKIWGIYLEGCLAPWVSAKDVILELLRRHGVKGGTNKILEYHGPGVAQLSAMDRHVIANMGAELGATASVFPSDEETRRFLAYEGREQDWRELYADDDCEYDKLDQINLSELQPLIAKPSSPQNVVTVEEVEGEPIYQAYIGSSANPGFRDFAIAAELLAGQQVPTDVSLDINPSTRHLVQQLAQSGHLNLLLDAGARLHQAGCNGCIGMGQAPASGRNSLRTTPRNFPGRSGTLEDSVWLCSPETAAASAQMGRITDPRKLAKERNLTYPRINEYSQAQIISSHDHFVAPSAKLDLSTRPELVKGPNIELMPELAALPDTLELPIILSMGDNISTDEIMPAGAEVLPFRSNIPRIAEFSFKGVDAQYPSKARDYAASGHAILAGENYGQGSSREHAALAPRFLGLRAVVATSFARIHQQNLINYGVLPLELDKQALEEVSASLNQAQEPELLILEDLHQQLKQSQGYIEAKLKHSQHELNLKLKLSERQRDMILAGSITNWIKQG